MERSISDVLATMVSLGLCYGSAMQLESLNGPPAPLAPYALLAAMGQSDGAGSAGSIVRQLSDTFGRRVLEEARDADDLRDLLRVMLTETEFFRGLAELKRLTPASSLKADVVLVNRAVELATIGRHVLGHAAQRWDEQEPLIAELCRVTREMASAPEDPRHVPIEHGLEGVQPETIERAKLLFPWPPLLASLHFAQAEAALAHFALFRALKLGKPLPMWLADALVDYASAGMKAELRLRQLGGGEVAESILPKEERIDPQQMAMELIQFKERLDKLFASAEEAFTAGDEEFYPFGKPDEEPY